MTTSVDRTNELVHIVADVLEIDGVNSQSDFFELGGDSLAAARLVNRLRKTWRITIAVEDVFAHPVLRELGMLAISRDPVHPDRPDAASESGVDGEWTLVNANQAARLERVRAFDRATQGGWSNTSQLINCGFRVQGDLDIARLGRAVEVATGRHDALRTMFRWHDGFAQRVGDSRPTFAVVAAGDCQPAVAVEPFNTIGVATAGACGGDMFASITQNEHYAMPTAPETAEAVRNVRVAIAALDLARDFEPEAVRNRELSEARRMNAWADQADLSLYPDLSNQVFMQHDLLKDGKPCTICGIYCPHVVVKKTVETPADVTLGLGSTIPVVEADPVA